MDRDLAEQLFCVVCGIDTKRHSGWFLVMENSWLDRIKVLAWHPVLAREERMHGVCCKEHLKTLLTHWLKHASLRLTSTSAAPWPTPNPSLAGPRDVALPAGRVVGELAVERESSSRVWTGSPEAMECILRVLMGGQEIQPRGTGIPLLDQSFRYSREYAFLSH